MEDDQKKNTTQPLSTSFPSIMLEKKTTKSSSSGKGSWGTVKYAKFLIVVKENCHRFENSSEAGIIRDQDNSSSLKLLHKVKDS